MNRFYKIPLASFEYADLVTKPLFGNGGEFLGPVSQRVVKDGFVYIYLHGDHASEIPLYRQEAWTCAFFDGDFSENDAYSPPENVIEITYEEYLAAHQNSED